MVQPSQKLIRSAIQRPFVKPSSPVCKRLFDFSDPNETKRMVRDMLETESRRLRDVWDFDARIIFPAADEAPKPREDFEDSPTPKKQPRYEWELQDRRNVPPFYTRPIHPHHSELRNIQRTPVKKQISRAQKLFQERKQQNSPLPLSCRDENASPVKTTCPKRAPKRIPTFTSPPKITSGNLNPSLVRLVTALRVPLPTFPQATSPNPREVTDDVTEAKKNESTTVIHTPDVVTASPSASQGQTTVNSDLQATSSSKRPASRQLFVSRQKNKRSREENTADNQPKLTEFIQQRKLRSSSKKRTHQESTNQIQVSTSGSQ